MMGAIGDKRREFESKFMADFWKFRKDNAVPEESDDYWNDLIKKGDALGYKYSEDPFVVAMVLGCIAEIEGRSHPNELRMENLEGWIEKTLNEIRKKRGLQKMRIVYESGRAT